MFFKTLTKLNILEFKDILGYETSLMISLKKRGETWVD